MKISLKLNTLLILCCFCIINAHAQFSAGIEDSRYAYGSYRFTNGIAFKIEHSIYSEKMGFQRLGFHVEYGNIIAYGVRWETDLFGATTWNGNYQVVGGRLTLKYNYHHNFGVETTVNPRYDSGLHYKTCWKVGISQKIIDHIDIILGYTTIPEFRMSEKRLRGGFVFKVNKLKVSPELSISMQKETRFKNMRVLMSMNYEF